MSPLEETSIQCPYCGETMVLLIDCLAAEQHYIEDCEVCCRPMVVLVELAADGNPQVRVQREDDTV